MSRERIARMVTETADALGALKLRSRLLEEVAWPGETEAAFFAHGAQRLPQVRYEVDHARLSREHAALTELRRRIDGDDPVPRWLRATLDSNLDRVRLLQSVGQRAFGTISAEVYGSSRSRFFGLALTNLDLANHLLGRLAAHGWDAARDVPDAPLPASALVGVLQARVDRRKVPLQVVLDPGLAAKAIAGSRRLRLRHDATFAPWEVEGLFRHEVETHAFSALNGAQGPLAPLLRNGGPRATPTQEGLAVFAELYHRALAVPRLRRLALRVRLVALAEDGGSFLDAYRALVDEGYAPREAYLDAARVFRGGPVEGGGAFTKDSCYLAGLVHVHAFLATFVRAGSRDGCEMLVCGRFALDDVAALLELRALGLLERPRWRPRWLRDWQTLLPYFAFASFLDGLDLAPVADRYADALRLAGARLPAAGDPC